MATPEQRNLHKEHAWSRLSSTNNDAFECWLDKMRHVLADSNKHNEIATYPVSSSLNDEQTLVSLTNLCETVGRFGAALYEWTDSPINTASSVNSLLLRLNLSNTDRGVMHDGSGLSLLQDLGGTPKGRFPPYQANSMNWHTDGYYNNPDNAVRCFTLHCVAQAAQGGSLTLIDDELIAYALWQDDPELFGLLTHPAAMTLPHNHDAEGHDRPDRILPVIFQHEDGAVAMRYTTRSRNIVWRCGATQAAAEHVASLIEQHDAWQIRVRLTPGQGIVTRNILHCRGQFVDSADRPKRQMLRGRFSQLPQTQQNLTPSAVTTDQ